MKSFLIEKVHIIVEDIDGISAEGVVVKTGTTYIVNIVVCVIGFEMTYKPDLPTIESLNKASTIPTKMK